MIRFRKFISESKDIFGFQPQKADEPQKTSVPLPIKRFDLELMMDLLGRKSLHGQRPFQPFINEIRWGSNPGAIKLEVDTGYTFFIKKLAMDKQGNPRWVTRKAYQLNRRGFGGTEDMVAQEIYEQIELLSESNIESPGEDYKDLERLVDHIYQQVKHSAREIFIPEGIKRLNQDAYIIQLGVRGQGVEAPGQRRVEQNQTMIAYDREQGTIRITNYNIESPTGGPHSWQIRENDLDIYFFPTQSREEMSDVLAVHLKYY